MAFATVALRVAPWAAPPAAALEPWQLSWFPITGVGTTPGTDYRQIVTEQPLDLQGLSLTIGTDEGWWCNGIPALPTGQAYTLLSTTGGLSGAYEGVPDGAVVTGRREGHDCGSEHASKFAIHYLEEGPVQTVTATVVEGSALPVSSTRVEPITRSPQTNQLFEFRARIATSPAEFGPGPLGTIAGGEPPIECDPRELTLLTLEALCKLPYSRWGNPGEVEAGWVIYRAAFTGVPGELAGSEGVEEVRYQLGETTTTLFSGPPRDGSVPLVALVAPRFTGPDVPEGEVRFVLDGEEITGCAPVTVSPAGSDGEAECRVPVTALPATVEALYDGRGLAFRDSASEPVSVPATQASPAPLVPTAPTTPPPSSAVLGAVPGVPRKTVVGRARACHHGVERRQRKNARRHVRKRTARRCLRPRRHARRRPTR